MMRHVGNANHIMNLAQQKTSAHTVKDVVDEQANVVEYFLYGFLQGMSFNTTESCKAGLINTIYYGFETFQYREIFKPWNTLKFGVATTKLTESTNTIYTYVQI